MRSDGIRFTGGGDGAAPSLLDRALRPFAEVRSGEGLTGVLMLCNVFLVLTAYYIVKPVREGWLSVSEIGSLSKMELKALSGFGQSLLLLLIVPLYGRLTDRVRRSRLVTRVNALFVSNLLVFWLLQPGLVWERVPYAGVAFYLWLGIFALLVVAQFWSFAADLYDHESGQRLFPLIAVGASAGAVAGAWLGGFILRVVDDRSLILVATVPLAASIGLTWLAERRGPSGNGSARDADPDPIGVADPGGGGPPAGGDGAPAQRPLLAAGAYRLVLGHRYLLLTAVLVLLFNWVSTNGDNVLFAAVQESLQLEVRASGLTEPGEVAEVVREGTTAFYGSLYFWVNLVGLLLQAFVASRLLALGGLGPILLALPVVALGAYAVMALVPLVAVIKVMKIAENSTNYSLNNTARHVLWLPTTAEMKYKAKGAVDTLFARGGDALAAVTVLVGVRALSLATRGFFALNVVLVGAWLLVAAAIVRENRRLLAAPTELEQD